MPGDLPGAKDEILLALLLLAAPARAELPVRIAVPNDRSGPYADVTGDGSVIAAQLAVEDFRPASHGMTVEVLSADHQNKPDIGVAIARRWMDVDGVDATAAVLKACGRVLGSVRAPFPTTDFSSYLVQAQGAGAGVVALANAGPDTINSIKQAAEFGIAARGQRLVALLLKATPIGDPFFGQGRIRQDGRAIHPMYLVTAKRPEDRPRRGICSASWRRSRRTRPSAPWREAAAL